MKYIRGWVGLGVFICGGIMAIFKSTRGASWLALGFGMGMMTTGFQNG